MPVSDPPIKVKFRADIIQKILETLMAGESCSLVGVGSCGKSNVARHLLRKDVQEYWLGNRSEGIVMVFVDCTRFAVCDQKTLFLELLIAVQTAIESRSNNEGLLSRLDTFSEQISRQGVSLEIRRKLLESALRFLFQSGKSHIFFVMDGFDRLVKEAHPVTLNSLRALRDNFKSQLAYVTLTRTELENFSHSHQYQDFIEIVSTTSIAIGAYTDVDAEDMIDRLETRWNLQLQVRDNDFRHKLKLLSGWHPGLLKAVLNQMRLNQGLILNSAGIDFLCSSNIYAECDTIWESLDNQEKQALILISLGKTANKEDQDLLRVKDLVHFDVNEPIRILSLLFERYIQANHINEQFRNKYVLTDIELELLNVIERQDVDRLTLLNAMVAMERVDSSKKLSGPADLRLRTHLVRLIEKGFSKKNILKLLD